MRRLCCFALILAAGSLASGEWYTAYVNDFSTLAGVSVRTPVTNLRLEDGGAVADMPATGYAMMDVNMDPVNGINIDPPIDFTYGEFTVSLEWYSEWYIPGEITGFWLRVYSRRWDGSQWVFSGGQNYFYEVQQAGSGPAWQTFTRSVDDWNETNWIGPFDPTQVYKFRIDSVVWDEDLVPYSYGIDHFELVVPECPNDLDGDDDIDLGDLAMLLSEYGCTPEEQTVYDTFGFESYTLGDLNDQDGWAADPNGAFGGPTVIEDPTGSSMGKVVVFDPPNGSGVYAWAERYLDTPIADGVVVFEWDQYRTDAGDNIYHWNCDGWFAAEWDSASPPGQLPPSGWAGGPAPSFNEWHHVRYELNLETGVAKVSLDGGAPVEGTFDVGNPTSCIGWGMSDTAIPGDGPLYLDNIVVKQQQICHIDYDEDNDTDLADLATLLADYGCGQ